MAKEMMIVFVYDTECCQNESDDPSSAVLYFHPGWVSDQQRLALCGQLMGTARFLSSVFSMPKILALQSGKFSLKHFGRYILVVGTDRNAADWVVEHRANTLAGLLKFFHCDIETISQLPSLNAENPNSFQEKLYHIFETYLPILQYGGNLFSNVPTIQLPKSASNVFLEAIQILQSCQETKGVLGGTLLYHNKVVATQLSSDLTKQLVITDPYRIKSPAETINTLFHLPMGVQILQVYVGTKEYNSLTRDANRARTIFEQVVNKKQRKSQSTKTSIPKEPIYSTIKRDQSLIFTTVPEEDTDHSILPTKVEVAIKAKSPDRPNSLNLRSTTADLTGIPSKPFAEKKVITPFAGQTSICSTPMTDRVLHGNVMSICCNPDGESEIKFEDEEPVEKMNENNKSIENLHPIELSLQKKQNKVLVDSFDKFKIASANFCSVNNFFDKKKCLSVRDVKENLEKYSKNVKLRYYSIGLKNLNQDLTANLSNSDENLCPEKKFYNTITDPYYPVFTCEGLPISKSLYDKYLSKQYEFFDVTNDANETDSYKTSLSKPIEDFDMDFKSSPKHIIKEENNLKFENESPKKPLEPIMKQRRSLSLPLKSLSSEQNIDNDESIVSSVFSPMSRRNLSGVQLTPLLSKLSILAMEEKSSGIGSRETTPSEFRDFVFTPSEKLYNFPRKRSISNEQRKNEDTKNGVSDVDDSESDDDLEKAVLFVCGQQNMVLMMLLESSVGQSPELILKLWEICFNSLSKLESRLHQCLDPCNGATSTDLGSEPYSYLCIDPRWDTVERGGPWGVPELAVLTHLHRDMSEAKDLTEIIVRNEDSIVYGYQCGETEVFYQQTTATHAGLPTPADLMGTVPLKARRRLERDHAIILF